jgi:hypothetical protein
MHTKLRAMEACENNASRNGIFTCFFTCQQFCLRLLPTFVAIINLSSMKPFLHGVVPLKLLVFLLFIYYKDARAQGMVRVERGTTLKVTGAQLVMSDFGMTNLGAVDMQQHALLKLSGSAARNFTGNTFDLDKLEIAMSPGSPLLLQTDLNMLSDVVLTSGYIDLGDARILLSENSLLTGQSENTFVTTNGDGYVQIMQSLDAPDAVNPGNLGLTFSSPANLQLTTVRLGFKEQVNHNGKHSILRNYSVITGANGNVKGTIQFRYLDRELNGLREASLTLWDKNNNNWTELGHDLQNTIANVITRSNVRKFSSYTLFPSRSQGVRVYPNPTSNFVFIELDGHFEGPVSVFIYDAAGNLVQTVSMNSFKGRLAPLVNVSSLPPGAYNVQIVSSNATSTTTFIKSPNP